MNADDSEIRASLWNAIRHAGSSLAAQCIFYLSRSADPENTLARHVHPPDLPNWRLVEILSLLMLLAKADHVDCPVVLNIAGSTGPLKFREGGRDLYLWAQPSVEGDQSALIGRPDLVITTSADSPSSKTITRVVECKCRKKLGAQELRAEFAKAVDFKVSSYLIWSINTPEPRVIEGARRLGLDLVTLGFDGPSGAVLLAKPEILAAHVGNTLEAVGREGRFAKALTAISQDMGRKALGN